jgi:hypothetical protein
MIPVARFVVIAAALALLAAGTGLGQTSTPGTFPSLPAVLRAPAPTASDRKEESPLTNDERGAMNAESSHAACAFSDSSFLGPRSSFSYVSEVGAGRSDLCLSQASAGPPACIPYEDGNGPLLKGSPLLEEPVCAPPGWFGAVELDLVGPHINNHMSTSVTTNVGTDQVFLPIAGLDWTISPHFELGYRFAQASGELLISYRFLSASGSETVQAFDATGNPGTLHSTLGMNVIDIDYSAREPAWAMGCNLDWKWRVGVRIADIFFDSTAVSPLLEQRMSNNFVGAGPHAGLEMRYALGNSGWALLGRMDMAVVLGEVGQNFAEVFPTVPAGGATRLTQVQPAPVLGVQAGLMWTPSASPNFKLSLGYTFERWWTIGETSDPPYGEVTVQGVFFRGEWRY